MNERWKFFRESLTDLVTMSKKEYYLTIAVCILGGIVFGFIFSPKKTTTIGSNNGNNNNGSFGTPEDEKENKELQVIQ